MNQNPFEPHRPIFTPHIAPHLDGFALITPHATYVLTKGQLHGIVGKAGQLLFPPPFID